MNPIPNKQFKQIFKEQCDAYLSDLDPTTTQDKIGHTTIPLPEPDEITDTSDELVSQKSFVPDDAKQYSKLKQNDNLQGNKSIEDEEKKYTDPKYNYLYNDDKDEILNIGEGIDKLKYTETPVTGAKIINELKEINNSITSLSSKLFLLGKDKASSKLDHITKILNVIEQELIESYSIDHNLEEEFKSKAQAKYFYAQANKQGKEGKEGKKWKKMADEFSSKTKDYNKLPAHIKESSNNNLNHLLNDLLYNK